MLDSSRVQSLMACVAAGLFTAAPLSQAGILLSEDFDYDNGAVSGENGGEGFAASSSYSDNGNGTATVSSGSLVFGDLQTSGGKLTLDAVGGNLLVMRDIGFSATTGNVWSSFLYSRIDTDPDNSSRAVEVRLNDGSIKFGVQPKVANTQGANIRYDGGTSGSAAGTFASGDVLLVIAKYENVGTDGATASLWILDEAAFEAISDDGVTEAELGTALQTDTLGAAASETISSGDTLQLVNATNTFPYTFSIDELRYGTTIEDIIPVPEPGSMVLTSLGALALLADRRRGR